MCSLSIFDANSNSDILFDSRVILFIYEILRCIVADMSNSQRKGLLEVGENFSNDLENLEAEDCFESLGNLAANIVLCLQARKSRGERGRVTPPGSYAQSVQGRETESDLNRGAAETDSFQFVRYEIGAARQRIPREQPDCKDPALRAARIMMKR